MSRKNGASPESPTVWSAVGKSPDEIVVNPLSRGDAAKIEERLVIACNVGAPNVPESLRMYAPTA